MSAAFSTLSQSLGPTQASKTGHNEGEDCHIELETICVIGKILL